VPLNSDEGEPCGRRVQVTARFFGTDVAFVITKRAFWRAGFLTCLPTCVVAQGFRDPGGDVRAVVCRRRLGLAVVLAATAGHGELAARPH
jgi:hypothetical protein